MSKIKKLLSRILVSILLTAFAVTGAAPDVAKLIPGGQQAFEHLPYLARQGLSVEDAFAACAANDVAVLPFDGTDASTTITDIDTSPNTFSANGNAQLDTAQKKLGTASLLLDGTGDYISSADSANWHFGTGNFTIEFWIRFASVADLNVLVTQFNAGGEQWQFIKFGAPDHGLKIQFEDDSVSKGDYVMTSDVWATPVINTWYHIAFVRNGTGGLLFIDGVSQTITENTAFGTNDVGNIAADLNIGGRATSFNTNGWIDDLRISKEAKYTANFTPPTCAHCGTCGPKKGAVICVD